MRFKHIILISVSKTFRPVLVLLISLLVLSGCGLGEIREQANTTENVGTIKGTVKVDNTQKGPIMVERFRLIGGIFVSEDKMIASANGNYYFTVNPGNYYISATIDANSDGDIQEGESFNYHRKPNGDPAEIIINSKQTVIVETITITDTPPTGAEKYQSMVKFEAPEKNIGLVVNMNTSMMNSDNYSMGLWRPLDFVAQVGGGLLFLQKYDKKKTPVLFVHGINGGPKNWAMVIDNMDRQRFQPWLLYYPSGVRLDMVSDYLVKAVTELQNKYKFKRFNVIAHSMGGLVTRSFIKKFTEQFPKAARNISLVMTINSPMDGMASAASGVKHSPIVISSWRDVATGSEFLENIHNWAWPQYIDYHLVFSYTKTKNGDGVVSLQSQIPKKLQAEAVRMYGFNNGHADILLDEQFFSLFNTILATSSLK